MYECKLERVFRKINKGMASFASIFVMGMMVVMIVNILMRRIFNKPLFGSTEMVSYMVLFLASLGLGHQEWIHNNITMTVLVEKLRPRAQLLFHTIVSFVCFIGFCFVSYYLTVSAIGKGRGGELTTTLKVPLVIPIGFMAVCFWWLCVCLCVETYLYGKGFAKYNDEQAARVLIGQSADGSEGEGGTL